MPRPARAVEGRLGVGDDRHDRLLGAFGRSIPPRRAARARSRGRAQPPPAQRFSISFPPSARLRVTAGVLSHHQPGGQGMRRRGLEGAGSCPWGARPSERGANRRVYPPQLSRCNCRRARLFRAGPGAPRRQRPSRRGSGDELVPTEPGLDASCPNPRHRPSWRTVDVRRNCRARPIRASPTQPPVRP